MSILSRFKRKPKPIVSVGPIPIHLGDQPHDVVHRPWVCAKSIVGDGGCVSLLGHPDDVGKWTYAKAMCEHHKLRMCPQYEVAPPPQGDVPWCVCNIETRQPLINRTPQTMSSVAYDVNPLQPDRQSRCEAIESALLAPGHVAFSIYPGLSDVMYGPSVKEYLAALVASCKRFPGKRWVSECGVNLQAYSEKFQAEFVAAVLAIPGLAGFNYTMSVDSPGYAKVNASRGGSFWAKMGLFDVNGNERPAAEVLRRAAHHA